MAGLLVLLTVRVVLILTIRVLTVRILTVLVVGILIVGALPRTGRKNPDRTDHTARTECSARTGCSGCTARSDGCSPGCSRRGLNPEDSETRHLTFVRLVCVKPNSPYP